MGPCRHVNLALGALETTEWLFLSVSETWNSVRSRNMAKQIVLVNFKSCYIVHSVLREACVPFNLCCAALIGRRRMFDGHIGPWSDGIVFHFRMTFWLPVSASLTLLACCVHSSTVNLREYSIGSRNDDLSACSLWSVACAKHSF